MANFDPGDLPRHPGVYVLRYQSGYFYVGQSENIHNRVRQHIQRAASRPYGDIYKVEYGDRLLTPENCDLNGRERDETILRMLEHGIDRVRGWEFIDDMHAIDSLHTIKQLIVYNTNSCRICGFRGHFASNCNTPENRATWLCEWRRLSQVIERAEDSHDMTDTEELTRCIAGMPFPSAIRHGQRWSGEEDNQLRQEIENGVALEEIAEKHGRTQNAIEERANRILYHSYRIYDTI